jgi:hypothetical protein
MGIEPTALAWEARVLPLYDARNGRCLLYPWLDYLQARSASESNGSALKNRFLQGR